MFILYLVLTHQASHSSGFDNEYNHHSGTEIKYFTICGERCSGTNFLYHLMARNFFNLFYTQEFGTTHSFWWFNQAIDYAKLNRMKYSEKAVTLADSENCLFIFIIRNPYDWLRSFYLQPHHVHKSLLRQNFFYFISSPWKSTGEFDCRQAEIDNCNPDTNQSFSNILELRKYKILHSLTLSKLVDNYLLVRYEDIEKTPAEFVHFVAHYYNLKKIPEFTPINTYKGTNIPYKKKRYFPFSQKELNFINNQTDWSVEWLVGFKKKSYQEVSQFSILSPRRWIQD